MCACECHAYIPKLKLSGKCQFHRVRMVTYHGNSCAAWVDSGTHCPGVCVGQRHIALLQWVRNNALQAEMCTIAMRSLEPVGIIDACEPLTILSQKHCMSHQVHTLCSNACLPMSMTVTCDGPVLEEASAADATNTFWITSDESIDSMRRTGDNLLRDGYPRFHPV